jgi:hypothetical protein
VSPEERRAAEAALEDCLEASTNLQWLLKDREPEKPTRPEPEPEEEVEQRDKPPEEAEGELDPTPTGWARDLWTLQDFDEGGNPDVTPIGGGQYSAYIGEEGFDGGQNTAWVAAGYGAAFKMGHNRPGSSIEGATISNVYVTPYYDPPKSKWGLVRAYNTVDLTIEACCVRDIHQEHALGYINPEGNLTVKDCLAMDCGGQALQVVNRETASSQGHAENNPWRANDTITVQDVLSYNNGQFAGRGSFALTITNIGRKDRSCNVIVERYGCYTKWEEAQKRSGQWVRSTGGLMIESDGKDYLGLGTVRISDFFIHLCENSQEPFRLGGVEDALVENGEILQENSGRFVELDKFDGREDAKPSKRIVWRNNHGNVRVRVQGLDIGHCSEDMVIENGVRVS